MNIANQRILKLKITNRPPKEWLQNQRLFFYIRKNSYSTESKELIDCKSKKYVRIGDSKIEIKSPKALEKVPRGYLNLYNNSMKNSQDFLKHLRWLMQKDELKQDSFLIGSPPGAFRRNLALSYAELTQREVEYLCLTRDTTESDIKQRREIQSNSVIYENQCVVNAALNGRILIIEGIEKAERNLLPILNNLLENREMNLDDGHFLTSSERYDKLAIKASQSNNPDELHNLNLLRVHQDFRVIAIGLPVPKYRGSLLDPPLRSRFQAHLVSQPAFEDYFIYLTSKFNKVDQTLIRNLCNFAYSFYTNEMNSLNLLDFPVENLDKIIQIIDKCDSKHLDIINLINKIYPHKFILKDEGTNKKTYFELMKKFDLITTIPSSSKIINKNEKVYEFVSIVDNENTKILNFKSNNELLTVNLMQGCKPKIKKNQNCISSSFVMNDYHSSVLVDIMLNHSSGHDFCLIGPKGSGKTELIKEFAQLLNYNIQTVYVYKDMNARDFFQQRITSNNGDTKWQNSILVEAAINGDLAVIDGIHKLNDDTIMSLRRLIQDRDIELLDGTKLLSSDKYDALLEEIKKKKICFDKNKKILRIHPSFRIIAVAEPPIAKGVLKNTAEKIGSINNQSNQSTEWLNSEVLNLFLFQSIEPLDAIYEHKILKDKFNLNKEHENLIQLMENLKMDTREEIQMQHIARLFSLRKLIKISNKLEKYPDLDLRELIENACLFKFMPQLNKQILNEFLNKNLVNQHHSANKEFVLSLNEIQKKYNQNNSFNTNYLSDLSKIPDTVFFENKLHTIILNNMIRDFELGEHLLLIGNQGTGKNKLADKFLMLTKKPREYIQLHRDTTVHSLTVQPVIKSGKITYEDSSLVKAVKNGHVLVIDEADKAPLHVTSILKSLIESNEMTLNDGRKIVPHDYDLNRKDSKNNIIKMHRDFRMIILANRPGFPFLGNDFFSILGDLLSCHPIDNPDPLSEIEMLRMYAPNLKQSTLEKLVIAFGQLRKMSDQGLIAYPYSTREIVNIVKHLEAFPEDPLSNVLANVYDFDYYSEQSDSNNAFKKVMTKNGIPIGTSSFQISLSKKFEIPKLVPIQTNVKLIKSNNTSYNIESKTKLFWTELDPIDKKFIKNYKLDKEESRTEVFSEQKSSWSLKKYNKNQQQIITDMKVNKNLNHNSDFIYICSVPLNLIQFNTKTGQVNEINLKNHIEYKYFYPRFKLNTINDESGECIFLFEENSGDIFKVNFSTTEIFKLDKFPNELNASNLIVRAKTKINKFFSDQNQSFKMIPIFQSDNLLITYKLNSNYVVFDYLNELKSVTFNYNNIDNKKFSVLGITQLSENKILIFGKHNNKILDSKNQFLEDINYFILKFPRSLADDLDEFELYSFDKNILGDESDLVLNHINLKSLETNEIKNESFFLTSNLNYLVKLSNETKNEIRSFICPRETPLRSNNDNLKVKYFLPDSKSIIEYKTRQVITQLSKIARPKCLDQENELILTPCLGYLEVIDYEDNHLRYIQIPKSSVYPNESLLNNYLYEYEFYFDTSPTLKGNFYTLDLNGNLLEWETDLIQLTKSLEEWKRLVLNRNSKNLKIEIFNKSPNEKLRDFKGPKHGKVDEENESHVGGNQWAGGSGGFDTAGLGGVGGPYRLDSGHKVFQINDDLKEQIPDNVRKTAKEMAQKAFHERLKEINMSEFEHKIYNKYLQNIKKPIQQMRNILNGLEAKQKEREWLKNQTQGDLDDKKLVEAVIGEKNVYKRRADHLNENTFEIKKPKRLKLVVDVSGSMYRFNGVDQRMERQLESVLMVMESFDGFESKILYDIIGHSGDGYNIKFVDVNNHPKNEADKLKVLKTMLAHSQFCSSGDFTFEATRFAIEEIGKEDVDDYIVVVLSDANFDRYGLSTRRFSKIILESDPKVNTFCIFIGSLGDQAVNLKENLPFSKSFVCMNTEDIPIIMQQIFHSAMLNN